MIEHHPGAAPEAGRLVVEPERCGPDGSANGGYLAGLLAARLPRGGAPAAQVALRRPPPLAAPLDVVADGPGLRLEAAGELVAEALATELDVDCVEPVPYEEALAAGARFPGLARHPFPRCWVCGTGRPDGLGLRPGPLPARPGTTAAAWTPRPEHAGPDGEVPAEVAWAALDCPGGWTVDLPGRPSVLGRMTAQVDALPRAGERCVVMGALLGEQGRRSFSATTLYDGDGRVLGRAHAVWVAVDLAEFARRSPAA
ncbi:hypothetical protein [Vallicoccus soli]|uniref:hypothetical protein n=1 Tax=Vallicoccus soli TaxID=2339232 RepID=UPI001C498AA3|nr:hypothetical protein [Vallicoccus soli]